MKLLPLVIFKRQKPRVLACSSLRKSGDDKSGRRDPRKAYCALQDAQRKQAFNQTASIISSRALQDFTFITVISSPSEI